MITQIIEHTQFQSLLQDLQDCRQTSKEASEPQCMALEGKTGAGKSTLIRYYLNLHNAGPIPTIQGTRLTVLNVAVPSPANIKSLAINMLEKFNDPLAQKGTIPSMTKRLIHFIQTCEVELVILDDFHHLVDSDTDRVISKVSNWLKSIIKESNVPFLVVGIEGRVERVLRSNQELSRLFAVRENLKPFKWDNDDQATILEFAKFVKEIEHSCEFPLDLNSGKKMDLIHRLYLATGGVVGNLVNLIRYAVVLAKQDGSTLLTKDILSRAYIKRLQKHLHYQKNPF